MGAQSPGETVECVVLAAAPQQVQMIVQGEEPPPAVPDLGETVGEQQHPIADRPARRRDGESLGQPEWRTGRLQFQRGALVRRDQPRRVMPGRAQAQPTVRVDVDDERRHEVLGFGLPTHRAGAGGGHLFRVEPGHRRLAEGAEHYRGQPDRRQALAADITDDHPDALRGGDDLVEIATHRRLLGGGEVPSRETGPVEPAWDRR